MIGRNAVRIGGNLERSKDTVDVASRTYQLRTVECVRATWAGAVCDSSFHSEQRITSLIDQKHLNPINA